MRKIAIIQARMGSSRFPGKVLENLCEKPVLAWVVDAVKRVSTLDDFIVATSDQESDNLIDNWCVENKIKCFRGSETDVLRRFYDAATLSNADIIVRITADCPLLDHNIVEQVLYLVSSGVAHYASNVLPPTWPDGLDCEAFSMAALKQAYDEASRLSDREHVTPYIRNNQHIFKVKNVTTAIPGLHKHRWTVDTREDLKFVEQLVKFSKNSASTYDYLETLANNPELKQYELKRNEGFEKSLLEEDIAISCFKNSNQLLERALKVIPLGSQTFSKSYIQYPKNNTPMFLTHGQGSRVWDVDGNEYIDMVSGLLPVILGYNDHDVNHAINNQLQKGISFSLATELEIQLAEKLCRIIPSAEKVRFAKNGTDVTSAAIRLARAYTGRDGVLLCGYHGWQDWSIGTTTRNKGIPKAVSHLSTSIPYNDLEVVETHLKSEKIAALIMEPCNSQKPQDGYLAGIKELCEKYGTLLIFDEVITGFRFALGGAQEYFGVTPHISCFGKAMGNGMPIAAVVGQDFVMKEMEEIFFSGTFGGESLSLAASIATIEKIEKQNVIKHIWDFGSCLRDKVQILINKYNLCGVLEISGYSPWLIFKFFDDNNANNLEIKTLFIQEMIKRGILINSTFNINFSHGALELHKLQTALDEVFKIIEDALKKNNLREFLKSGFIQPLFKVR